MHMWLVWFLQLEQLEELNHELREEKQNLRNELGASVAHARMQDDSLHKVHAELQARAFLPSSSCSTLAKAHLHSCMTSLLHPMFPLTPLLMPHTGLTLLTGDDLCLYEEPRLIFTF